jgi:ribosomal protein S18 acetylase RimI-like enzyme
MTMEIVKATHEDLDGIHGIYSYAVGIKLAHGDKSWRNGFTPEGVRWMIDQGTTYAVRMAGELVGVTALEWSDDGWDDDAKQNAGYIRRLAIAEGQNGKGLGGLVIDWALEELARQNRQYLRLDCPTENKSLCGYYEKLGFRLIETKTFENSDSSGQSSLYQKSGQL